MTFNWKAILPYILGLGTASTGSVVAFQQGWLSDSPPPTQQMPALPPAANSDSPDKNTDTTIHINPDEDFRTSDQPNEKNTQYQRTSKPPKNALRVGCICMDYIQLDVNGGGACAGRGGVRFWLYQLPDGAIVQHATPAHNAHPEPLNPTEMQNLRYNGKKKTDKPNFQFGMFEVLFGLMFCVTVAYIVRVWFAPPPPTA
jgi:hypothetical protein